MKLPARTGCGHPGQAVTTAAGVFGFVDSALGVAFRIGKRHMPGAVRAQFGREAACDTRLLVRVRGGAVDAEAQVVASRQRLGDVMIEHWLVGGPHSVRDGRGAAGRGSRAAGRPHSGFSFYFLTMVWPMRSLLPQCSGRVPEGLLKHGPVWRGAA